MSQLTGLNFFLGEEVDMLRDAVAGFAAKEIAPRAEHADRSRGFAAGLSTSIA